MMKNSLARLSRDCFVFNWSSVGAEQRSLRFTGTHFNEDLKRHLSGKGKQIGLHSSPSSFFRVLILCSFRSF